MKKKLGIGSRIIIGVGALAMCILFFVPAWSIYLQAPQYPEGLSMQIWLNKLTGQVEIINGLNHYIGMKHIVESMFPEFDYLFYILGFFVLFGLVIAITGKRKLLFIYLVLSVVGGIAAMIDFWTWGYKYGHELDPKAAIQVPGLTYQPPLIGHKKLLNFDSYSYPDIGGWVIVGVSFVFFITWFLEWRKEKKFKMKTEISRSMPVALAMLCIVLFSGCTRKEQKFIYGKDTCAECKMTIVDQKFGAEIVTKKGKVYKFDDTHCLAQFFKKRTVELSNVHKTLFVNYNNSNEFIRAKDAQFVVSSLFRSPMGGNSAAFKNVAEANSLSAQMDGSRVTNWATLYNVLVK